LLWCVVVLFLIPYRFVRALVRHDLPIEPRPWSLNPYRVSENILQKLFPPPARLKQQQRAHGDQGFEDQEFGRQQQEERLIAVAHKESPFKHIPGQPWGDPSSYAKPSLPREREQTRDALIEREAEKQEHEDALKELEAEKRESETDANRSRLIH